MPDPHPDYVRLFRQSGKGTHRLRSALFTRNLFPFSLYLI